MRRILNLAHKDRIVFADAEYINGALHLDVRPSQEHWKEVTQIGAVRCVKGNISEKFNVRVLPRIMGNDKNSMNEKSWQQYQKITGIDKENVMSATMQFEDAWEQFKKFVDSDPIVIMLGDREVYKWNWKLLGKDYDDKIDVMDWIILKPLLKSEHQPYCSGELASLLNISIDGNEHDALYDATSMALYCLNID